MRTRNWAERVRALIAVLGLVGGSTLAECAIKSPKTDGASPSRGQGGGMTGDAPGNGGIADAIAAGSDAGQTTGNSSGAEASTAGQSSGGSTGGSVGDGGMATGGDSMAASSGEGGGEAGGDSMAKSSGEGGLGTGGEAGDDGIVARSGEGGPGTRGPSIPGVTKDSEVLLTDAGVTIVSFGGYLNGESFQQDGIVSFQGFQYAAFWNASRHVVVARRSLPSGAWAAVEFTDYINSADDAHNTISLGICPGDGTLHLSFDHHVSNLHYRTSVPGLVTNPTTALWAASSFSAVASSLGGNTIVSQVTYPRFVTEPGGGKMLFEARIGSSGSGDEYLWEYDGATHAWTSIGMYIYGTIDSVNAYAHGLSYTKGGSRLHTSWCWRETPDAATDHDLFYIYSDDHGRTWNNNAGATVAVTGSSFVTKNSAGIKVWTINQNRGLINQEHMAVDPTGRVHLLLSHMPDSQPDDPIFASARTKSVFFHYWRDTSGTWTRTAIGLPVIASFRGKLAISSSNSVYAILPDLRVAAASAAANFSSWVVLSTADSGRFFSDPLIDTARLVSEDKLSVFYPQSSSSNIYVLDYTLR